MIILVLFLSTVIALVINQLFVPRALVLWDESVYLMWTYHLYEALGSADAQAIWQTTLHQYLYPPLQSWVLSIPLLFVGFSIESARTVGLFWFILGTVLTYLLGSHMGKIPRTTIGLVAALLFMSSPMIIFFSSLALKEVAGASLTILVILSYIRARTSNRVTSYITSGMCLFILFMTKYNFAAIPAIAILIEYIVESFRHKKDVKTMAIRHIAFASPFLIGIVWWVTLQGKRILEYGQWVRYTEGLSDVWGYVLYYPRTIIFMYSASEFIGIFLLAAYILALCNLSDFRIRILWLTITVNLLYVGLYLTFWINNVQDRYIFTVVPLWFVLGATIAIDFYKRLMKPLRISILVIFVCIFAFDALSLPKNIYALGAYTLKSPIFNQLDYKDQWFNYDKKSWPHKLAESHDEHPRDVVEFVASSIDLTKPIRIVGTANELAPDYFALTFADYKKRGAFPKELYASYVITIEVLPISRLYNHDFLLMNAWKINEIRDVEQNQLLQLKTKKQFQELGVEVGIYTSD